MVAHASFCRFVYVDRVQEPVAYNCSMSGATTVGCCFLKPLGLPPYVASPIRSMVAGVVTGGVPPPPPLTDVVDPPSGMRSAVPLGGISCGAVELRGDGSLREWTIVNQSPGGSAKIQTFADAYFAVKAGADATPVALQTHPLTPGLKGVQSLTYRGSYPVTKLTPSPVAVGVHVDLFAYSTYSVGDMEASARPMAAFTLAVSTDAEWATATAEEEETAGDEETGRRGDGATGRRGDGVVSFMMNLPTAIESDMLRTGTPLGAAAAASSSAACLKRCNTNPACLSWNHNKTTGMCALQKDAPDVFYALGTDCGLRGGWSYDHAAQCLTLDRPGVGGSNGNMSLCGTASGGGGSVTFGTYDTGDGAFVNMAGLNGDATHAHGAIVVTAKVPPSSNATLTITFGWYFPERDHFGKPLGNYYKNLFRSSTDAAFGGVAPAARDASLAVVVTNILAMQGPFHSSSLEPWLQDHLVNSLSHIRTAMWFDQCPHCHKSNDTRLHAAGFWRQWEAFDCPDIDSIHNDGERHIPYIMFWPNTTRNKLAAWAGNQAANGMLAEQIHNVDPDTPEGRVMADSSSMFICFVLELLRWAGDRQTLGLYWPTVKRAAEWQMNVSAAFGVPYKLQVRAALQPPPPSSRFPDASQSLIG